MPPLSQVFAVRGYLALFIAASLSTWGDYIARLTIAAVVYDRTQSPLATATTLAVSLVPSIFGRSVLGPVADRIPYKYVLIASHVSRAAMVLVLIWAVSVEAPVPALLVALFVLETLGGPASAAQLVQLQHAAADPALRTTSTMAGLDAAEAAGQLTASDARSLRAGWTLAASLRNASVLWRGRPVESVPADMRDADGIGRIIGRPPGAQSTLEEDYLRVARRCRAATDQNFYQGRQD